MPESILNNLQGQLFPGLDSAYFQLLWLVFTLSVLKFVGRCHPGRNCFLLLLLPVIFYAFGGMGLETDWLSWVFNPLLCVILLLDRFVFSVSPKSLTMSRQHAKRFSIHNENLVTLGLVNHSAHPVYGELLDEIPAALSVKASDVGELRKPIPFRVSAKASNNLSYVLYPIRRGPYCFGRAYCRYKSMLGLLWINATLGEETEVDVYPDLKQIQKLRLKYTKAFSLGELQKRKLGAEGTQFDSLRTYVAGDDLKKISWQATARLDTPIIRVHTHEVEQPIVVLIDAGRKMLGPASAPKRGHSSNDANDKAQNNQDAHVLGSAVTKFDCALNAALAFATVALDRGDEVMARVFHQETVAEVPLGRGKKQCQRLLDTLAHVAAKPVEPDYQSVMLETGKRLSRRAFVVLFTDMIDPLTSRELVNSLLSLARHHVVLVATWQDEALSEEARHIPESLEEAYRQGVRLDLLDIRNRTLRELSRHANISVVDTTPEKLDERVIDRYVSLKLKNRI
ncbi:MAG: DUF58 domain-containing protein [Vampirovibrionales bacterium]|nr:DUF58 domain-containing protein [Vampirovibrionales bacterium]